MPIEIVMPRMGLTMEEGTVVAWLKGEGQAVRAGEPLLEIETDKTTVEIEAPGAGVMGRAVAKAGDTVPVGEVIGYLLAEGENSEAGGKTPDAGTPRRGDGKVRASPAARRMARELSVELGKVSGTGPGGRIVAWNVEHAATASTAAKTTSAKASPVARRLAEEQGVDLGSVAGTGPGGRITRRDVERAATIVPASPPEAPPTLQPLTRSHRLMAERMTASFTTTPHFYLHAEVDARPLLALLASVRPRLEARARVRLTVTDLLVRFCALTLARHPQVTAQWAGEGLRPAGGIHVGVAVDAPGGLIVPVICDADRQGLAEISRQRADLAERARGGRLLPRELELGVFTLSNLGMFRVDSFDAILNPPQAAILAVGRIMERALAENGALIAAPTMKLSLSVDHRVLDGAAAARFLGNLVELLETPVLALE